MWRNDSRQMTLTALEQGVCHFNVAWHSSVYITIARQPQRCLRAVSILAIATRQQRRSMEAANFRQLHQMGEVLRLTSGYVKVTFRRFPVARRGGSDSGDGLQKARSDREANRSGVD